MSIFYRTSFLLVIAMVVMISCANNHKGQLSSGHDSDHFQWTTWKPYVPEGYSYERLRGIDSFIGKITNGTITFNFDYGMYGGEGPADLDRVQEIIERYDAKCQKIIEAGSLDVSLDQFKERFEGKQVKVDSTETSIDIMYHDTYIVVDDLGIEKSFLKEAANLDIEKSDHKKYRATVYYPKSNIMSRAAVVINEKKSRNSLNFYTFDYTADRHEEIMTILSYLRDNYMSHIVKVDSKN